MYIILTHLCFTSVTCFFMFLYLCYPLDLRNSERTAHGYDTNSWGYGVILVSCKWILCLAPLPLSIFGEMWKLLEILPKIWGCPHLASCRNQVAQPMKTGKYSFKRGIIALHFGEKYASFPVPIFEKPWRMRWGYQVDYCLLQSITQ